MAPSSTLHPPPTTDYQKSLVLINCIDECRQDIVRGMALLLTGARSCQPRPLAVFVILLASFYTLIIPSAFAFTSSASTKISIPMQTTDQCILHYTRFHLIFTIPQLFLLYFLAAPFLTALDWYKIYLLPVIAFIWTTPWDNELVRKQAWWYPKSCVLARIGYVPVEEYAFFIIQSLMTTLLTILITRWSTPRSSKPHSVASLLPLLSASLVVLGLNSLFTHKDGQGTRYYLSMITWWACIPLTLLWWGTSQSWAGVARNGQVKIWLMCVALPTAYLCSADVYAMRRGTWHISEKRSLQFFVVPDLPIEEAIFFLATNTILVSACFAFDRVVWQTRGEEVAQKQALPFLPPLSPNYFNMSWKTVDKVWNTFTRLDVKNTEAKETLEIQGQRDCSMDILARASKSFSIAASLLPWDLRVDLGSLYAFARVMDDFIDQPMTESGSICNRTDQRIKLLRRIASLAFDTKEESHQGIEINLLKSLEQFRHTGEVLTTQQEKDICNSALSASLLRCIVPYRLWDDLIDGYSLDSVVGGPHFTTLEEQADYAQSVAGAIGEMCVRVVLGRIGISISRDYIVPRDVGQKALAASSEQGRAPLADSQIQRASNAPKLSAVDAEKMLRDARRMGVCLQLVNIARDIVKDAKELERCYLVTGKTDKVGLRQALRGAHLEESNHEEEEEVADLVSPIMRINNKTVFSEKIKLLDLADEIYQSSIGGINLIPCRAAQTGLRVACAVYANIGSVIRREGPQKCMERSKAQPLERLWVAIKAVYGF